MSGTDVAVGLDVGGSTTTLWVSRPGATTRDEHDGPAASLTQRSVDDAATVLATLLREATRSYRPMGTLAVCAGVAGAGRPAEQDALSDALRAALDNMAETVRIDVCADAEIALAAAFGDESGVVVIAGTGSMVLGRTTDGTLERAGGWGPRLGDPGSGRALGRAGLRAVAEALDGGPETTLRRRVAVAHDIADGDALIRRVYDDLPLANVAPTVIEAAADGDAVASEIVSDETGALAQHVAWLAGRTGPFAPRVALVGGLTNADHYAAALRRRIQDRWPDASVAVADRPPVAGALHRARWLLGHAA